MIRAVQLSSLLLGAHSSMLNASVKNGLELEVQPNNGGMERGEMVTDHIVEANERETVCLPSPTPLPAGQPYTLSWSRRGKEIFRWVVIVISFDANSQTQFGFLYPISTTHQQNLNAPL